MAEPKTCSRCKGTMTQGTLKEIGHFGNSPFEWAPDGEPSFALKGAPKTRRSIVAHRCENCGLVELSAP
jgi:hypothetical protein